MDMKNCGYSFLLLLLFACGNKMQKTETSDTSIERYWVNSSKADCIGVGPMTCLQIQKTDSMTGDWENFYSNIQGFEYQPGYLYRIEVKVRELPPNEVPADASSRKYELVKILEKMPDPKLKLIDIWALKAIQGESVEGEKWVGPNKQPYIEFTHDLKKFMGTDGCNQISGKITRISEDKIEFGPVIQTKMACPDMRIPNLFHEQLGRVDTWTREGLDLIFMDKNKNEILRFKKVD
jgi:heat shock protein HslJ